MKYIAILGITYLKECQPDCKASRNERCQRIEGLMKCVCRPGFARMFPDRPCKRKYCFTIENISSEMFMNNLKINLLFFFTVVNVKENIITKF